MIYDASHTLGLIAGGVFQDPLQEGCNILQGNTHKTFPGPQKGMIHFRDKEAGLKITDAIGAGLVSNQHAHHAVATYITTLEMYAYGAAYAQKMLENGKALASALSNHGFDLISRNGEYTSSHQIAIYGDDMDDQGRRLFECGISINVRNAFGRRIIRLGVQEVTRRGMDAGDMEQIAQLFKDILINKLPLGVMKKRVLQFNNDFPNIGFSFDKAFGLDSTYAASPHLKSYILKP